MNYLHKLYKNAAYNKQRYLLLITILNKTKNDVLNLISHKQTYTNTGIPTEGASDTQMQTYTHRKHLHTASREYSHKESNKVKERDRLT